MARRKGTFQVAGNYEPLKAAPFDARAIVESKVDLITESAWKVNDLVYVYNGMVVSVTSDVNAENNGVYVLLDAENYSTEDSWQKLALTSEIVESQTTDIEVETESDLPENGKDGVTYYVKDNGSIYRWQEETQSYISFGNGSSFSFEDIVIINGGTAYGANN